MPAKRKGPGHPSPYEGREMEIALAIAERLKTGEPLAQILRDGTGMPSHDALADWRVRDPRIERIFVRARDEGFDAIAADCLAIADETSHDTITTERGEQPDSEWIQRSKLRVETRLKLLAKWDPKRYGDKVGIEHSGNVDSTVTTVSEPERLEMIRRKRACIERRKAITGLQ